MTRSTLKLYLLAALILAAAYGIIFGIIAVTSPASAHEAGAQVYDRSCCQGNVTHGDCQPISDSAVTPIDGGYLITLAPGVHHLVTRPHSFTRSQSETRKSDDGRYHVCLYPTEEYLRCFYAPPFGS